MEECLAGAKLIANGHDHALSAGRMVGVPGDVGNKRARDALLGIQPLGTDARAVAVLLFAGREGDGDVRATGQGAQGAPNTGTVVQVRCRDRALLDLWRAIVQPARAGRGSGGLKSCPIPSSRKPRSVSFLRKRPCNGRPSGIGVVHRTRSLSRGAGLPMGKTCFL
jgi:hypothetical protein